jgi:hypothetical protein
MQSGRDVNQQFPHMRSDIRRILLVSGFCLVVLIGLWLLLR